MKIDLLYRKALELKPLTIDEGLCLYENVPLAELLLTGMELRNRHVPGNEVG